MLEDVEPSEVRVLDEPLIAVFAYPLMACIDALIQLYNGVDARLHAALCVVHSFSIIAAIALFGEAIHQLIIPRQRTIHPSTGVLRAWFGTWLLSVAVLGVAAIVSMIRHQLPAFEMGFLIFIGISTVIGSMCVLIRRIHNIEGSVQSILFFLALVMLYMTWFMGTDIWLKWLSCGTPAFGFPRSTINLSDAEQVFSLVLATVVAAFQWTRWRPWRAWISSLVRRRVREGGGGSEGDTL
jgi:hypothetical protein